MNVKELKDMISDLPDEQPVLIVGLYTVNDIKEMAADYGKELTDEQAAKIINDIEGKDYLTNDDVEDAVYNYCNK